MVRVNDGQKEVFRDGQAGIAQRWLANCASLDFSFPGPKGNT